MRMPHLALMTGAAETWVRNLDAPAITRALIGLGLWSPADGADPTEDLAAAYRLARRWLGLEEAAIIFREAQGMFVCRFIYSGRFISVSGSSRALALARAVLRVAYQG
jgi:hypothetical protein